MPTVIDAELHEFRDWKFRFRPATNEPSRIVLLLHGWTGDENSMWVFSRKLSANNVVLSLRAPFKTPGIGFSWREIEPETWGLPGINDLCSAADGLISFVDDWSTSVGKNANQFDLIGFSQGAAISYVLALLFPERIRAMAALSGFLPAGAESLLARRPLEGKLIYITHGRQDEIIPVEQARKDVRLLEDSGARVIYCESDGGHKVSVDCFTGLTEIFG